MRTGRDVLDTVTGGELNIEIAGRDSSRAITLTSSDLEGCRSALSRPIPREGAPHGRSCPRPRAVVRPVLAAALVSPRPTDPGSTGLAWSQRLPTASSVSDPSDEWHRALSRIA